MTFCAKNVLSNSLYSLFILIFFWLYLYRAYYTGKVICLLISTVLRILSRLYYTYFAGRILFPGSFAFTGNKRKSFLYCKGDLFICETDGRVYYSRIKFSTRTLSMNTTVHVIFHLLFQRISDLGGHCYLAASVKVIFTRWKEGDKVFSFQSIIFPAFTQTH